MVFPQNSPDAINLLKILRSPRDTVQSQMILNDSGLVSPNGRNHPISDGIIDMFCPELEPPDHSPRQDSEWELWQELYAPLIANFTYSGGMLAGIMELGHAAAARHAPHPAKTVLEIGSGVNHHLLSYHRKYKVGQYINLDTNLSSLKMARQTWQKIAPMPYTTHFVRGSCYNLPFHDGSIDHVVSIYVFEHLYYLKQAVAEMKRVLTENGTWCIVLPTEGGLAWSVGRRLTFSRSLKKRYGIDYDRIMGIEHCNTALQVADVLETALIVTQTRYLPFLIPTVHINAVLLLEGTR